MYMTFNCQTLPEIVASNLQGLSWSFSHFFLWKGGGVLFDCGESAGIRLDEHVFQADVVALSHAHSDHCQGLVGFLQVRTGIKGATDKPLTIAFPEGSGTMETWLAPARAFVEQRSLDNIRFEPCAEGLAVTQKRGRLLEARTVPHTLDQTCFAYRSGEMRRRLRHEYRNLSQHEITAIAQQGGCAQIEEPFFDCDLVYSGDTEHLDREFCRNARVLIHEATFLNPEDAKVDKEGHNSTVEDALRCAGESGVRNLILFHISRRYEPEELRTGICQLLEKTGVSCPVVVVRGAFKLPTD